MRMIGAASLVAVCGMLAFAPARADTVPPFKGNDTGGIIAYSLTRQTDIRTLAINHCASYGKVVKFLAVEPITAATSPSPAAGCRMPPTGRCAPITEPRPSRRNRFDRERRSMTRLVCILSGDRSAGGAAGARRARG